MTEPNARSRHNVQQSRGYLGRIPNIVWFLLELAHERGFSVSSNTAREHAQEVALAASMGWISTVRLDGKRALRRWNVTAEGLTALNHKDTY